jgi:hypothetical protein
MNPIHYHKKLVWCYRISVGIFFLGFFLFCDHTRALSHRNTNPYGSALSQKASSPEIVLQTDFETTSPPPAHRVGTLTISLVDEAGQPWVGANVTYEQVSHDFLYGVGMTSPTSDFLPYSIFEELYNRGVNLAQPFASWAWLEPEDNQYDFHSADRAYFIPQLKKLGYTLQVNAFHAMDAPWNIPDYIKKLSPEELIIETGDHMREVVKNYRGIFKYYWFSEPTWQFCNMGEPLCLTHSQWVEMARTVSNAVHQNDPDAELMIVLIPNDHPEIDYYPLQVLDRFVSEGVQFDAIGIEVYPYFADVLDENGYPDLNWLSSRLDQFAAYGVPIMLDEMGVPDIPSQEAQAEWMRNVYQLAFDKPYIIGAVWLFVVDHPDFLDRTGLFPDLKTAPRLIYDTYAEIIAGQSSQGSGMSDASGRVTITGIAGDYRINITGENRSLSLLEHISAGESSHLIAALPTPTSVPTATHSVTPTSPSSTPLPVGNPPTRTEKVSVAILVALIVVALGSIVLILLRNRKISN